MDEVVHKALRMEIQKIYLADVHFVLAFCKKSDVQTIIKGYYKLHICITDIKDSSLQGTLAYLS